MQHAQRTRNVVNAVGTSAQSDPIAKKNSMKSSQKLSVSFALSCDRSGSDVAKRGTALGRARLRAAHLTIALQPLPTTDVTAFAPAGATTTLTRDLDQTGTNHNSRQDDAGISTGVDQ
jgi:hypothetical protein